MLRVVVEKNSTLVSEKETMEFPYLTRASLTEQCVFTPYGEQHIHLLWQQHRSFSFDFTPFQNSNSRERVKTRL